MRRTSKHPKTYKRQFYTALLTKIPATAGIHELRVQTMVQCGLGMHIEKPE